MLSLTLLQAKVNLQRGAEILTDMPRPRVSNKGLKLSLTPLQANSRLRLGTGPFTDLQSQEFGKA
jgi:hypothetical protein